MSSQNYDNLLDTTVVPEATACCRRMDFSSYAGDN